MMFILCIFLVGCNSQSFQKERTTTAADQSTDDTATDFSSYFGEWDFWNNPDVESEGGVTLELSVSDQFVEAEISAWSKNFNRLAAAYLSGIIQGNKVILHFDDDGRGQTGNVTYMIKIIKVMIKEECCRQQSLQHFFTSF